MSREGSNHHRNKHSVVAVNPDGTIAGHFDFVKSAAQYLNVDRHTITLSCRNGTICRGLRLYYEEDFKDAFMEKGLEGLKFILDPRKDHLTGRFLKGIKTGKKKRMTDEGRKAKSMVSKNVSRRLNDDPNSNFGRYRKSPSPMCKKIICVDNGQVFSSIAECSRELGVGYSALCASLKRMHRCYGQKFMYLPVYEEVQRRLNANRL